MTMSFVFEAALFPPPPELEFAATKLGEKLDI